MPLIGLGPSSGPLRGGTHITLYSDGEDFEKLYESRNTLIVWVAFEFPSADGKSVLERKIVKATFSGMNELKCTSPSFETPGKSRRN